MKKIIMVLAIVILSVGVSGCSDPKIDDGNLKRYKSTKQDVLRTLGQSKMRTSHNGKETWTYTKTNVGINAKGAGWMGAGLLATMSGIPGGSFVVQGAQLATDGIENADPVKGKAVTVSYTFNKRGVLVDIMRSSYGS